MSQTKAGGQLAKQRMIEKLGSEEAYKAYMSERGRNGGKNGIGKGGFKYMLEHDPERLSAVSRKGGSISRRTKKTEENA